MFGLGPAELIILGVLCFILPAGVFAAVMVVAVGFRISQNASQTCPKCNARSLREAKYCQGCGVQL